MASKESLTGHDESIETKVIARSISDRAFRARLLADPKAALEEMGIPIPPGVNIHVSQEDAANYYLVLPPLEIFHRSVSDNIPERTLAMAAGDNDFYTEFDSHNANWTGCASGASGCAATNGCTIAWRLLQGAGSGTTPTGVTHCAPRR
jgi:hypothetical protein